MRQLECPSLPHCSRAIKESSFSCRGTDAQAELSPPVVLSSLFRHVTPFSVGFAIQESMNKNEQRLFNVVL